MIHGKADEGFKQLFVREINGEFFRARFEQRTKTFQMLFGQQNGDDFKTAFEQATHDFFTLGDKDALSFMLQRPAHRAIGREFRQVERGDFFYAEHFKDFCAVVLNRKGENSGKFSSCIE